MKVLSLVCCLAVATLATPAAQSTSTATSTKAPAAKSGKAARTVEIAAGDDMKFDTTEIAARPGETLRIVLKSTGKMPKIAMGHNFVLLKPGVDQVEFNKEAFNARETDFIPPTRKADVIANTPLVGPGETVETTFKVPAAGKYPFVCSFPGHFALGMRGTLTAKKEPRPPSAGSAPGMVTVPQARGRRVGRLVAAEVEVRETTFGETRRPR